MRLRREVTHEALTLWADQYVTKRDRQRLGDDDAAALAHRRMTARSWERPAFVPDEGDVSTVRPVVTAKDRQTDEARSILAMRARALDGRHGLPFRDEAQP